MVSQHPFPSHQTEPPYWGHPTLCRDLRELIEAGTEVDLVCMTPQLAWGRRLDDWPGLRVYGLGMHQHRSPALWYPLQYGLFFLWALLAVSMLALGRRYDVVEIDNIPDLLVFSALVPRLQGVPLVYFVFDLMPEMTKVRLQLSEGDFKLRLIYWLEHVAMAWADRIITVSDLLRRILAERGVDPSKVVVVPNSFDIGDIPERVEPERPVLILPSTLIERNGAQVAVRAMAELRERWPDLTLQILGGGEYRATLMALASELGLEDRVTFSNGFVPRADAVAAMRRSTIGVVPLLPDGYGHLMLPNKVFEFVFMDIPFACSRLSGIAEHLPPDAVGYFEPGDVHGLARQIDRLLRDREGARRQAARAKQAMAELAWSRASRRYVEALGVRPKVSPWSKSPARHDPDWSRGVESESSLYGANTPAAFWRLQIEPAPSDEQWAAAVMAAAAELPPSVRAAAHDMDRLLEQSLGEGQFGADHWQLSPWLKLYYGMKPMLPRQLTVILRRLRHRMAAGTGLLGWPIEERWVRFQLSVIDHLLRLSGRDELPYLHFWPDQCQFAFVLTHDVERAEGQQLVRELADIDASYGLRSSFNFVPEGYRLDFDVIAELQQRGFEVGIHGLKHDGRLFQSHEHFLAEAQRINRYVGRLGAAGFRAPCTHRNPEWMQALDIDYDLSFFDTDPYEPVGGGTMSLWPFQIGRFIELPYTLTQDYTLTAGLGETTPRLWLQKVDYIERYSGMALVNTHPDYLTDRTTRRVYTEFLDAMQQRSTYWNAVPAEVARWWRARQAARTAVGLPRASVRFISADDVASGELSRRAVFAPLTQELSPAS
jgi:glycosyltransferase involved in cell wall biosynthesis/peptidoglycan/xylan/chitin deacetylase (PgdA/CDA1 family)